MRGRVTPQPRAARPSPAGGEFSAATMLELVRALRARAVEHPESPGLIASWPGVRADRMPAACAELQRRGHAVREVVIVLPTGKERRGWMAEEPLDGVASPAEWSERSSTVSGAPEATR